MNVQATSPPAQGPDAAPAPSRIDWLFRDSLRRREIHPLVRLLQRHRDKSPTAPTPAAPGGTR